MLTTVIISRYMELPIDCHQTHVCHCKTTHL